MNDSLWFDFHGVSVEASSPDLSTLAWIDSDFFCFRTASLESRSRADIALRITPGPVPEGRVPDGARRIFHTKDAVVRKRGRTQFYDSPGRALVIYDFAAEDGEIFGDDRDLVLEKAYLLLLSRVGALLDRRGMHRLHAMAVSRRGRAVVCLLPTGGGKTTLALSLLNREDVALLSDEIPLISRDGGLHGFPIRLGVVAGTALVVPPELLRTFHRSRHGPKTLIHGRWLAERTVASADPAILLVARRTDKPLPSLRPLSRTHALTALVRLGVLGSGLPELREYAVRFGLDDALRLVAIYLSRVRACLALLMRSSVFALELSSNREANAARVDELLEQAPVIGCARRNPVRKPGRRHGAAG